MIKYKLLYLHFSFSRQDLKPSVTYSRRGCQILCWPSRFRRVTLPKIDTVITTSKDLNFVFITLMGLLLGTITLFLIKVEIYFSKFDFAFVKGGSRIHFTFLAITKSTLHHLICFVDFFGLQCFCSPAVAHIYIKHWEERLK